MRPWQFRQKTIGFGLSSSYYLTVMAATAQLPPVVAVVNPKGEGGAVEGFLVPLGANATKEDLARPLMRGIYAASSRDRKTVLRMMVMSKEEVGFDPTPFVQSSLALGLPPETLARIRATWTLIQLTFESHDPFVHDSVRFVLRLCQRLADLTDGVVADPICLTYRTPAQLFHEPAADPKIDARDHVVVQEKPAKVGNWLHTLGLQKFSLPELEITAVPDRQLSIAGSLLMSLAQRALLGQPLREGDRFGDPKGSLELAPGGLDASYWKGIPCLEILPPTGRSIEDALVAWSAT